MAKTSPTQRSLKLLRDQGWTVAITERWNPFAKIRQDLYGFCDLLCISPTRGIMAVQTTSNTNLQARVSKILAEPRAAIWLASGGQIMVHGWSKKGPRNARKLWTCREQEITNKSTGEAVEA